MEPFKGWADFHALMLRMVRSLRNPVPRMWKRVREMGKDRTQRIADTAPKALRQQMRDMAREAAPL